MVSRFTYAVEILIQAGRSKLAVTHVAIRTNPTTRESRLFSSPRQQVVRLVGTQRVRKIELALGVSPDGGSQGELVGSARYLEDDPV